MRIAITFAAIFALASTAEAQQCFRAVPSNCAARAHCTGTFKEALPVIDRSSCAGPAAASCHGVELVARIRDARASAPTGCSSPVRVGPVRQALFGQPEPLVVYRLDLKQKSFAKAMSTQLKKKQETKGLTLKERRLARIINSPDSEHRDRVLKAMEDHTRVRLGLSPTAAIDWDEVPWEQIFQVILQLVLAIIDILL